MASLRTWFRATQPHSFVASLVGVALGTAVAWNSTRMFGLVAVLLAAIGLVGLQAATNMSNDSIDFKRGVDDLPAHLVSPFTGGARVLPDTAVSFEAHRRVWIGFFAAAALIGIVLALIRPNGWILLVLGGIGGAIGVFYTLPPFALQYHGVGEIAVAIIFGPLVVLGSYAVQTGAAGWEPLLAAIPHGRIRRKRNRESARPRRTDAMRSSGRSRTRTTSAVSHRGGTRGERGRQRARGRSSTRCRLGGITRRLRLEMAPGTSRRRPSSPCVPRGL